MEVNMSKILDVPLDVKVLCEDYECGRSIELVIDPEDQELTHVVVREHEMPHEERLVPIEYIEYSTPSMIQLSCKLKRFQEFDLYCEKELLPDTRVNPVYDYLGNAYVFPLNKQIVVEHKSVPKGELPLVHHARIEALDGHLGRLDELLVDPETDRITHLVMTEGHLFGSRDVSIPVTAIEEFDEYRIKLKLTKDEIRKLPEISIQR
jgi:sporulation protein YlmC with PRC-barrel domain